MKHQHENNFLEADHAVHASHKSFIVAYLFVKSLPESAMRCNRMRPPLVGHSLCRSGRSGRHMWYREEGRSQRRRWRLSGFFARPGQSDISAQSYDRISLQILFNRYCGSIINTRLSIKSIQPMKRESAERTNVTRVTAHGRKGAQSARVSVGTFVHLLAGWQIGTAHVWIRGTAERARRVVSCKNTRNWCCQNIFTHPAHIFAYSRSSDHTHFDQLSHSFVHSHTPNVWTPYSCSE
jgi:hypothetical protein